ncbi:MAG: UbiA family prenyltransferase [Thermoanaerobaculia bacterium]|nr:UbiA family prenyltransferase [Thermoanaerobaculia bacterium]
MTTSDATAKSPATLRDYVALARLDHWVKHVFIVPGIVLAELIRGLPIRGDWPVTLLIGFVSAVAVASANYVINEWLDARSDAHHPTKKNRPAVQKRLSATVVWAEYGLLLVSGLALASLLSPLYLAMSAAFAVSGLVYNVPPLRFKERAFLDVLVESVNNPIRLTLGWALVDPETLPPSSLVLCYWMGGAFLMTVKRLAEMRFVTARDGREGLSLYRSSFRTYTEGSLIVCSLVYALTSVFLLAVFLVKYRIEYLLSFPFIIALFSYYLALGLREGSVAQTPELLFRDRGLLVVLALVVVSLVAFTLVDVPILDRLAEPHLIPI